MTPFSTPPPFSTPIEKLTEHEGFVTSLARAMLVDRHLAEDVAQDVWLATLRSPQIDPRKERGWLRRVTVRMVGRARHAARSRRRLEEAVAASEVEEDTSSSLMRAELLQWLMNSVLSCSTKCACRDSAFVRFQE